LKPGARAAAAGLGKQARDGVGAVLRLDDHAFAGVGAAFFFGA